MINHMELRDLFAAAALQGLIAHYGTSADKEGCAATAFAHADAMMPLTTEGRAEASMADLSARMLAAARAPAPGMPGAAPE